MGNGPRRIVIVGGGISGLAAAYSVARAREAGAAIEGHLIEAGSRLGGVIRTEHVEGCIVEAGPDSFLTAKPEAAELCRELGLSEALLGSNDHERRTHILHRGRLIAMPDGLMMLVPTRLWPMATTTLLPLSAKLKAAREWFLRPPQEDRDGVADESVASFITRHFGRAMLENVAEPLLAGVYGGDSAGLSARSVLTRFWEMERSHGSLTRGVLAAQKRRAQAVNSKPEAASQLFTTLTGGMEQMIAAIERSLVPINVHLGRQVVKITRDSSSTVERWQIDFNGGASQEAEALILALPATECARLIRQVDNVLADSLAAIPYSSALIVSFGFDGSVNSNLPPGFGFLVPQKENRNLLACTFVHRKFAGRAPEGKVLLRSFLGGARHPELLNQSDEEIVATVRGELRSIMGISAEPIFHRVYRWPSAMAQYTVGHDSRIKTVLQRLESLPGLYLAGNAYGGIGISDCIRSGRQAAQKAIQGSSI
jgi:protoporphyrinogen/coproporphyrinogen III oxidase